MNKRYILLIVCCYITQTVLAVDTLHPIVVTKPLPAEAEPIKADKTISSTIATDDSQKTQRIVINNQTDQSITALFAHKNSKGKLRDAITVKPGELTINKSMDVWFENKVIKDNVTQSTKKEAFPNGISFNGSRMYNLDPEDNTFTITKEAGKLRVEQQ